MSVLATRLDAAGIPLQVGAKYLTGVAHHKARTKIRIEEDEITCDLIAVDDRGNRMRLDDFADSAVFEPQTPAEGDSIEARLKHLAAKAQLHRDGLDAVEASICELLNMSRDSDEADFVMHFVRDGFGDVDRLLELAGS
jgi:hypothetical protein